MLSLSGTSCIALSYKTNLTQEEIIQKHKTFLSKHLSGFLTKQEFMDTFKQASWKTK
jgi:Ca2+-binding EF-hand superfamily protein